MTKIQQFYRNYGYGGQYLTEQNFYYYKRFFKSKSSKSLFWFT